MLLQLIQMMDAIVADANAPHFTSLDGLYQCLPVAFASYGATIRCVDVYQVYIIETCRFERCVDLGNCFGVGERTGVDL